MKSNTKMMLTMLVIVAMGALFAGCSGDDSGTAPTEASLNSAPKLPSVETMTFNLDFFGADMPSPDAQSLMTGKASDDLQAAAGDRTNFINAIVRALFVQLLMYDALEEPIGAFALAVHSVPQEQNDGSYLWTYIFVEDNVEYSIFLYGTPQVGSVLWRLEVSTDDGALNHFVWFDGEFQEDDTGGYWQFYEPVTASTGDPVVRIDVSNTGGVEQLRVTVNSLTSEDSGDILTFTETDDEGSITFLDASTLTTDEIRWYVDGTGYIDVSDYNNGERGCWDDKQKDTICPQP